MKFRTIGVSATTALFIFACGGGGGSTGGGGGTTGTIDGFLIQYCDVFQPCCAKANKAYDQAKCRALFSALVGDQTYDPAKGQQCLDAARGAATSPTFCEEGTSSTSTGNQCSGVFSKNASNGTKKPGEQCDEDGDCADSGEDTGECQTRFTNGASTRTCQLQGHGKEGEDNCTGEKDGDTTITTSSSGDGPPPDRVVVCWLADGLYCDKTTKKCTRMLTIGSTCSGFDDSQCSKAAFCDFETKKCLERRGAGGDCGAQGHCLDKHRCSEKKCIATLPNGSPCKLNDECDSHQCTNEKCGGGSSAISLGLICAQ